jgi:hypothetical protein
MIKAEDLLYKRLLLVRAKLKVDRRRRVSWESASLTRLERCSGYVVCVSKLTERLTRS